MTLFPTRTRSTRSKLARTALTIGLAGGLLGVLAGCSSDPTGDVSTGAPKAATGGSVQLDGSSKPPWPAPTDVPARVAAAGLGLGPMGMAEHYHPELRILINGDQVPVAANIGVDPGSGAMSAVHTHASDGTIHVEAGTAGEKFTLGQVFTEWGVALSRTQVGGVRAEAGQEVAVTSNGTPVTGDPMDLRLAPEQKIVVRLP